MTQYTTWNSREGDVPEGFDHVVKIQGAGGATVGTVITTVVPDAYGPRMDSFYWTAFAGQTSLGHWSTLVDAIAEIILAHDPSRTIDEARTLAARSYGVYPPAGMTHEEARGSKFAPGEDHPSVLENQPARNDFTAPGMTGGPGEAVAAAEAAKAEDARKAREAKLAAVFTHPGAPRLAVEAEQELKAGRYGNVLPLLEQADELEAREGVRKGQGSRREIAVAIAKTRTAQAAAPGQGLSAERHQAIGPVVMTPDDNTQVASPVRLLVELEGKTVALPGATTRSPVTIAFSQLRNFARTAPDGTPATGKFRWGQQLQPGDVISGQRDPWAVVTHVTWSGPEVAIRVQDAGGSRTMTSGTQGPSFDVRADLRVDPSTCPDIPDGFPPRWGVWRSGPGQSRETTWFPEPGEAAQHARQASQDGNEYVVELESPDGCWTHVDAYQQGRRSAWGTQLAAGQTRTVMPPWATPGPVPATRPSTGPARRPAQAHSQPSRPAPRRTS